MDAWVQSGATCCLGRVFYVGQVFLGEFLCGASCLAPIKTFRFIAGDSVNTLVASLVFADCCQHFPCKRATESSEHLIKTVNTAISFMLTGLRNSSQILSIIVLELETRIAQSLKRFAWAQPCKSSSHRPPL